MSISAAAVFILPGGHQPPDVRAVLPSKFRSTDEPGAPAWNVPDVANGRIMLQRSPVGFDILIIRFSIGAYYAEQAAIEEATGIVQHAAEKLGLLFAYLTRYEDEFSLPWIEDNVLVPMLMDEPERIPLDAFERVLLPPRTLP